MNASDARTEANRANASLSTGPRTDEGKTRSSQNAVKHGMGAKAEVVLPGEVPGGFQRYLGKWVAEQRPGDEEEFSLVETAARAGWTLKRCWRYDECAVDDRVEHAEERHEIETLVRAGELGRTLTAEGVDAFEARVAAARLKTFAAGAEWLIGRWEKLLRGAGAGETVASEAVGEARRLLADDREGLEWLGLAPDAATFREVALVAIEVLKEMKAERLDGLAEFDRRRAPGLALFDSGRVGTAFSRYEGAARRALHRATADLVRLRKARALTPQGCFILRLRSSQV